MEQLTQSQFISKSIVLIIFGIVYLAILVYCARRDPSLLPQKKKYKTLRTILGILSLVLCGLSFVLIVIQLSSDKLIDNSFTEMGYNLGRFGTTSPTETMKETEIGAYPIYRNSNASVVWGYPSQAQSTFLSTLLYFFVFLGLGLYLLLFKPSDTSKGKKALKVIGFILLWFTYSGILSLHYFDSIEFIPIICITGLAILCLFVFARNKHIATEMNNYENNLSGDKIQQEIKPKEGSDKKHRPTLFALGFIISIPLLASGITCFVINEQDNRYKTSYNKVWIETDTDTNSFQGLPCIKVYAYYDDSPSWYKSNHIIGYRWLYSIPDGYDLSIIRNWFFDKNDNDKLVPFLGSRRVVEYCILKNHPLLLNKEAYYWKSYQYDNHWESDVFILENNMFCRLCAFSNDNAQCDENLSKLLSYYNYPKMRIADVVCYLLTGLCLVFWIAWTIVYYSQRIKRLKESQGLINKSALRLSRHVLWCTVLWFIIGGIAMFYDDYDDVDSFLIIVIGILVFIINMFILRYTINRINQEPSEDYLIPKWFKLQNANVLKNMGIVRLFLLFIIWPIFVLIPVPFVGAFAIMYSVGVLLLYYLVFYGIKGISWITTWIISGTKTKVSYKENE